PYTIFKAGEAPVGGLMELPADARKMGAPPHWIGYIVVDDVDAATDKARSLGGSVYVEPQDIPEVGRFSVVTDPQKAAFCLFKS
ncbi:VOC family protein, partial [Klebsiella pneumoniae]|uniref:VOC family protein n=1 Tax=Klebsiella pneumoniae TaxID=573 RepID=UPI0013D310D8